MCELCTLILSVYPDIVISLAFFFKAKLFKFFKMFIDIGFNVGKYGFCKFFSLLLAYLIFVKIHICLHLLEKWAEFVPLLISNDCKFKVLR